VTDPAHPAALDVAPFVRAWTRAVNGTCHVPMTRAEKSEFLRGLAERLAVALVAEPFDATAGYWVATDLVAADFDAPEALGRTIAVVNDRFLTDLGLAETDPHRSGQPNLRARLTDLVQAFATGFARARHDRTFDAQEEIRVAALTARFAAERELRASEARFRYAATHDALTQLPNRALFTQRLDELVAGPPPGARFGVCFIGLDGFQAVKNSLGPYVGDNVLTVVAERLRGFAAESGHLVARLGGDEFAVLVAETTCLDDAVKVADRVAALLDEPIRRGGLELPISARVGVVEQPATGTDTVDVLRAADMTLHWVKADGKARWMVFDPERNAREVARYRLSAAMPTALNRGEFTLAYQPLVNLGDGTLAGLEALARWRHPDHGLLGPEEFVGLAEDTGLIVPLGISLLEEACRQAAGWLAAPNSAPQPLPAAHPPYVSVNLAVRQLRNPGLVGEVAAVLDRTGLVPHRLQLEITESAVIDPATDGDPVSTLQALADLGIRIAIDDFGTGYSNLGYLPTLPIHGIKLARYFLAGTRGRAVAEPTADAFLANLVSLGHTLGLTVTAEGVETATHARRLRAAGCDVGQGWYFGRPELADRIANRVSGPWT
jgi:diguanylate cyclase (GGDEF)-like protein